MTYRIIEPTDLPPDALDDLLARGWFRMRQFMFTTRYTTFGGALHDAVWTRLPLQGYVFRKSVRRLMRQVEGRYTVRVGPARVGPDHEALYRRYAAHVGSRPESLEDVLREEHQGDPFDTCEVSIHDGDALVAFSLFDRGRRSLQSIIGVYDPDPAHARYGLGFATMLFEVRFGLEHGFLQHYAGYLVPGVPGFDYKRRIGPLEWYDPELDAWRPLDELDPDVLPGARMNRALAGVAHALAMAGFPGRARLYPPWRFVCVNGLGARFVDQPLLVLCGPSPPGSVVLAISFSPEHDTLAADVCLRDIDLEKHLGGSPGAPDGVDAEWHLLDRVHRLTEAPTASALVSDVVSGLGVHGDKTP